MAVTIKPNKCAEGKYNHLIIIINSNGDARCYERDRLMDSIKNNGLDFSTFHSMEQSSYELLKNLATDIYQEYYIVESKMWYLTPLKGTVTQYIDGLLQKDQLAQGAQIIKVLGEGTFGKILQYGVNRPIVTKASKVDIQNDPSIIKELAFGVLLENQPCCVVSPYGSKITARGQVEIYMKLYSGDLYKVMYDKKVNDKLKVFYELLKGMYYAYRKGLMHLDLKPPNVLVNDSGNVDISDWGISNFFPYGRGSEQTFYIQTPSYRAPEIFLKKKYDSAADVFSLGVIGYELIYDTPFSIHAGFAMMIPKNVISAVHPGMVNPEAYAKLLALYGITRQDQLFSMAIMQLQKSFLSRLSPDYRSLILQMTCNFPEERPTFAEALNHPCFKDIRGEEKFPEIEMVDILYNLPTFHSDNVSQVSRSIKFGVFRSMMDEVNPRNFMALFLGLTFFNVSEGCRRTLNEIQLHQYMVACYAIASSVIEEFPYATANPAIKDKIPQILQYLNFKLFGSIPIMFFRDLRNFNLKAIEMLLEYEFLPRQRYHPQQIAKYIGNIHKIPIFDNGYHRDQIKVCEDFAVIEPNADIEILTFKIARLGLIPVINTTYNTQNRCHMFDGEFRGLL